VLCRFEITLLSLRNQEILRILYSTKDFRDFRRAERRQRFASAFSHASEVKERVQRLSVLAVPCLSGLSCALFNRERSRCRYSRGAMYRD
jgi:hypothetical protein